MGANRGKTIRNSTTFTSFLLGVPYQGKIVPLSQVGTGLPDQLMEQLNHYIEESGLIENSIPVDYDLGRLRSDVYFRPEMIFEVHAQELTRSPLYHLGKA